MERAAEWSRATALANPSVMRVGSKRVMFLSIFVNSGFTLIYFAVKHAIVVTDMVTPNALPTVSACLCGTARNIGFASKRLAVSRLQPLSSVLCSFILCFYVYYYCFVFID